MLFKQNLTIFDKKNGEANVIKVQYNVSSLLQSYIQ